MTKQPVFLGCAAVIIGLLARSGGTQAQSTSQVATQVQSQSGTVTLSVATQALLDRFPGVRVHADSQRILALYAAPMTAGPTASTAAAAWSAEHAAAFGVENPDLRLAWSNAVHGGQYTVFAYQQFIAGFPVEQGFARLLVLNGSPARVVYAAARLAASGTGVQRAPALDSAAINDALRRTKPQLTSWSEPQLLVYYGEGDGPAGSPRLAYRCRGHRRLPGDWEGYTFYVDAMDGSLLHTRDDRRHVNITGVVRGRATPGLAPDTAGNPPTLVNLQDARLHVEGGATAYSQADGSYVLPTDNFLLQTLECDLTGRWIDVDNTAGPDAGFQRPVTPPGPADFEFNAPPAPFTTAEINAHVHATRAYDFYASRQPDFAGFAPHLPLTCNVNLDESCNAFFEPQTWSINFYRAKNGCANTAYSTVVAHEFGHFVVETHNLAQNAFGEGFSDALANLIYDNPVVGQDLRGPGTVIRDSDTSDKQYPCFIWEGDHACGQVLAGVWWDLKAGLQTALGAADGVEAARQLFTDWMEITTGGRMTGLENNSADAQTAIEVLAADDDDGNLLNGTPHCNQICNAFSLHGISCPAIPPLGFAYPDGLPAALTPNQPTVLRVDVYNACGAGMPVAGSGTMSYRSGGAFTTVPLTEASPNQYVGILPAFPCGQVVQFYFGAQQQGGGSFSDPPSAPAAAYTAVSSVGEPSVVNDDFEQERGWTSGAPGDNAAFGQWERTDPVETRGGTVSIPIIVQPGDDHTPPPGTLCWVTAAAAGDNPPGSSDVDGGKTTLLSPVFNLANEDVAFAAYWRWYSNDAPPGANPNTETFRVDVSDNGGATWVNAETLGEGAGDNQHSGGWFRHEIAIHDLVNLTASVRVRFVAEDRADNGGALVEAAIDDFTLTAYGCEADLCRRGDLNGDGAVNGGDIVLFIRLLQEGGGTPAQICAGDLEAVPDGIVSVDDIPAFVTCVLSNGC